MAFRFEAKVLQCVHFIVSLSFRRGNRLDSLSNDSPIDIYPPTIDDPSGFLQPRFQNGNFTVRPQRASRARSYQPSVVLRRAFLPRATTAEDDVLTRYVRLSSFSRLATECPLRLHVRVRRGCRGCRLNPSSSPVESQPRRYFIPGGVVIISRRRTKEEEMEKTPLEYICVPFLLFYQSRPFSLRIHFSFQFSRSYHSIMRY